MVDIVGTTKFTYTAGNQLLTEDGPFASDTITNTYVNRLRTELDLQQSTGIWTNAFGYDAAKRLTNVVSPAGSFDYAYLSAASHLPKKISIPDSYITNTYDNVARLTGTYLDDSSGNILNSHQYGYNVGNQRTNQTFYDSTVVAYTYDPIGQLKWANSSVNTEDRGYLYDAAWNLDKKTNNTTVQSFTVNGLNELSPAYSYDDNGNQLSEAGLTLEYDDENQLVAVQLADTWRTEFKYDGLGRLRRRWEFTWQGGNGPAFGPLGGVEEWYFDHEVRYIYDGWRVIQERNEVNVPLASYTRGNDLSGSLEGAGGIGGMLARTAHSGTGGANLAHAFYHADGNGNITCMVDDHWNILANYKYDPFGNTISKSGILASTNVYRFSSKESFYGNIFGTELYYYGYRFYSPYLQRWLNRDPIEERGGVNLYAFVGSSPINFVDKYGLEDRKDTKGEGGISNKSKSSCPVVDLDNKKCAVVQPGSNSPPHTDWDFVRLPDGSWYKIGYGNLKIGKDGHPGFPDTLWPHTRPAKPDEAKQCQKILDDTAPSGGAEGSW